MNQREHDLIVVGGGPAGLSAAINAASEGLSVCVIEQGSQLGGQARHSRAIENYAGFPESITGADLIGRFADQAVKFGVRFQAPLTAENLEVDGTRRIVTANNFDRFTASTVLLSVGLTWRRLEAENIGRYMGAGVFYGTPPEVYTNPVGSNVVIVGGANSAAQAALDIARNKKLRVTMLVRRPIKEQASAYLVDRIYAPESGITVIEGVDVTGTTGNGRLKELVLKHANGSTERLAADYLLVYIGATPQTLWVERAGMALDERKFILTGPDLGEHWKVEGRNPLPLETSIPGVFAAGDITLGPAKRIAKAVGDGSAAVSSIHSYLRLLAQAEAEAPATKEPPVRLVRSR